MAQRNRSYKVIISGGGTGGHIYPAIAIARALQEADPRLEVLFVGAKDRMEMEKVPAAGYKIEGLWISGIQRRLTADNLMFPVKVVSSFFKARQILKDFAPDIAVGVGGYASFPLLYAASGMGIPTLIQEQNGYAGVANKFLAKKAKKICVAYHGMEKFFPAEKLVMTGNPVRGDILNSNTMRAEGQQFFKLDPSKKTVLVIGGSLGARTINESIDQGLERLAVHGLQVIWQTGKGYINKARERAAGFSNVWVSDFIYRMDLAYGAADVVVSRAGALSISELCLVAKPCILVPSPNVAEDHQTKNAMALVEKTAALMVRDDKARQDLISTLITLCDDQVKQDELSRNITALGKPDAAKNIAEEIFTIIQDRSKNSK